MKIAETYKTAIMEDSNEARRNRYKVCIEANVAEKTLKSYIRYDDAELLTERFLKPLREIFQVTNAALIDQTEPATV